MRLAALILSVCLLSLSTFGQTIFGSLTGTIYDASGAVVPDATVIVRNLDTGISRELKSDAAGTWRVPSLQPGRYAIEVTARGFEKLIQNNIPVESSVERSVDFRLSPGSNTEIVTVEAEAPLIEATRSTLSRGVEAKRAMELPGFNTQAGLALLAPGAVANAQGRPGSGFVINGARTRSNNFMLDGANNNDQSLSIPRQNVAVEYLGEFRLITSNFGAEFGRNSGAIVQQNTRSGTNEFHGAARWSWLGNGLDALTTSEQRTFNAQKLAGRSDFDALRRSRGVFVRNQVLGSAGGRIIRDKMFFFAGYDTDRRRATDVPITTAYSAQAFALLEQNQNLFAPGTVAFLKATYPVANDPTPVGNINLALPDGRTIVLPVQQFSRGGGAALSYARNSHRGLGKIDYKITSKDDLSTRVLIDDDLDPGRNAPLAVNQLGSTLRNYGVTTNHVRTWTSTLISESRFTFSRREANFIENFPAQFSITGSSLPTVGNQNSPQFRTDNVYEGTNNWTWIRGKHSIKFGGNYLFYDLNSFFAPAFNGVISYPSLADFLQDRNGNFSQYAGTGLTPADTHEWQFFLGDDWRATSSLTFNLGIRYEYTTAPFGYFSEAKADINNWAPRFGFAYNPKTDSGLLGWITGNGKMVVRGGYGISYDQVFQNILLNVARNYPRGVTLTVANQNGQRLFDPTSALRTAVRGPEQFTGNTRTLPYRLYSPNQRINQPYGQQFNFGIERQFLGNHAIKVFYVGTRGISLIREAEQNIGFFQSAINANPSLYAGVIGGLRPTTVSGQAALITDPTRGSILVGNGYGSSTFHSLQTTWERRLSKGLQFTLNYTWSTNINNTDDILGGQANRTLPSVPFNWNLDRARSGFDQPHRLVADYVYEVPFFKEQNGFLGRILGGYQLAGITTMAQGTPFSVLNANNPLGILPGQIGTINGSQRALFNPAGTPGTAGAAFTNQWIAAANNTAIIGSGANILRVGNTFNYDLALSRFVRITESTNLQLRWDVFNAFNRRNFDQVPNNTAANNTNLGTFLNLGQTNVGGRTMVLTARFNF